MNPEATVQHWYWSHDIAPDQVATTALPGFRLIRLARYDGFGGATRFAAVCHRTPGPARTPALDLTAGDLARKLDRRRAYPADLDAVRTGRGIRYTLIVRFNR